MVGTVISDASRLRAAAPALRRLAARLARDA